MYSFSFTVIQNRELEFIYSGLWKWLVGESVTQHIDPGSGPQSTVMAVYFHNSNPRNGGKSRDRDRQILGACWTARQTPCSVRDTDSDNKVENGWGEFQAPTLGSMHAFMGIHIPALCTHTFVPPPLLIMN